MKEQEQQQLAAMIAKIIQEQSLIPDSVCDKQYTQAFTVSKKPVLTLEMAKYLLNCGEEKAVSIGVPMVFTVADDGGNTKAQHRMDGSLLASIAISAQKAYTAAAIQSSTAEAAKTILPGQPLYGLQNTHPGRFCLFGGGIPLFYQDCCIGAVGVSGGTVEQDVSVAEWIAQKAGEIGLKSR